MDNIIQMILDLTKRLESLEKAPYDAIKKYIAELEGRLEIVEEDLTEAFSDPASVICQGFHTRLLELEKFLPILGEHFAGQIAGADDTAAKIVSGEIQPPPSGTETNSG